MRCSTLDGDDRWVSRSADKLVASAGRLRDTVDGRVALDVGASTGGFTQVLSSAARARSSPLDVGHGQLVQRSVRRRGCVSSRA